MADTYRCRLRFRVLKKLHVKENEYQFSVGGRPVVLSAPAPESPICESEWLVMNARGFAAEADAQVFGYRIKTALELASAQCRFGVDTGTDLATSSLASALRDNILKDTGAIIRNNVHGLDVFIDDPNVRIFSISGTGSVSASPEPLLSDIALLYPMIENASQQVKDIILLLNYALMRPEPVAQIIFAVSAVEMLGQDETWSDKQRLLLEKLAMAANTFKIGTDEERGEVADAISKSLHRLTLRQGVLRLLSRLGLTHLKREWDALYKERSTLVHGLAPKPGANYGDLANRAMNLCGQILLRAIALEFELALERADTYYQVTS